VEEERGRGGKKKRGGHLGLNETLLYLPLPQTQGEEEKGVEE